MDVGDVLLNGDTRNTVLEVLTQSCLLSYDGDQTKAYSWFTFSELEEEGYTIEQKEWSWRDLKEGEKYWYIDSSGGIDHKPWRDDQYDKFGAKTGNIYQTKEDAEKALAEIMK